MAKAPTPTPKQIEKKIEITEGKNFHKELKIEKIEKLEHKELKLEKVEKNELKEHKHEKIEKPEIKEAKHEKIEIKEHTKIEIKEHGEKTIPKEKDGKELVEGGGFDPGDPGPLIDVMKAHLEQLEAAASQVRHFIDNAERPDLGEGALKNEKGKGG